MQRMVQNVKLSIYFVFSVTTCPEGWNRKQEFCYLLVKEKKKWQDASSECVKKEGNLVSIHNKEENDFIQS